MGGRWGAPCPCLSSLRSCCGCSATPCRIAALAAQVLQTSLGRPQQVDRGRADGATSTAVPSDAPLRSLRSPPPGPAAPAAPAAGVIVEPAAHAGRSASRSQSPPPRTVRSHSPQSTARSQSPQPAGWPHLPPEIELNALAGRDRLDAHLALHAEAHTLAHAEAHTLAHAEAHTLAHTLAHAEAHAGAHTVGYAEGYTGGEVGMRSADADEMHAMVDEMVAEMMVMDLEADLHAHLDDGLQLPRLGEVDVTAAISDRISETHTDFGSGGPIGGPVWTQDGTWLDGRTPDGWPGHAWRQASERSPASATAAASAPPSGAHAIMVPGMQSGAPASVRARQPESHRAAQPSAGSWLRSLVGRRGARVGGAGVVAPAAVPSGDGSPPRAQ